MGYRLRNGVSFCRVADRYVFLDIADDRYFGLPASSEQAFARLVAASEVRAVERDALRRLCAAGLLQAVRERTAPRPCPGTREPRESLLDAGAAAAATEVAMALAHRFIATRDLKRWPLARLLGAIAAGKAGIGDAAVPLAKAAGVAAAFRQAALILSAHDRCLATSIAVMRRLLAKAVRADLVLGVKLRPFQAHCWVQLGDVVVNDRVDTVGLFTPILIL
jgi:hypothetical protein